MNKKNLFSLNIGLPTIFLVFIVFCLLSLSVLSFVSAKADWNLCQKALEHETAYYNACNRAEEFLQNPYEISDNTILFPISDLQSLEVKLSKAEDGNYRIQTWRVILNNDISYDESLHVIP